MSSVPHIPGGGPVADIPEELRACPQWVGWRLVDREGKATKVPICPHTGGMASSTTPATWGTFDAALAGAVSRRWDGVGFVFSPDDPYCGIDLDEVVDEVTGEMDADAVATIDRFTTYTEFSPSRTGVHLIIRGSPPGGMGRKKGDRECYDRARFFTFTGLRASSFDVCERGDVLAEWHAETFPPTTAVPVVHKKSVPLDLSGDELVRKIGGSKQGAKFVRLWLGDTTGYASGSEADLALCSILAFWCGRDAAAVDRMFRGSGLIREKWDAKRSDTTYGARTVLKAITGTTSEYDPGYRSKDEPVPTFGSGERSESAPADTGRMFLWASELTAPPKADEWLWEGYLPRGGVTLLSALWKVGKTTLMAHVLRAFATTGEFLGRPIRASRVLYISEEGIQHWVRRRDAMGLGDHIGFSIQPFATKPGMAGWVAFVESVRKAIIEFGFDLVIIDTLAKLWPVVHENDAGEVDAALMPLQTLTKAGAGVLVIHHLRKGGSEEYTGSRGSGALSAFPDIVVELTRFDPSASKDRKRKLRAKGRYGEETPDELVIELDPLTHDYRLADTPSSGPVPVFAGGFVPTEEERRILTVLRESADVWMQTERLRDSLKDRGWGLRFADVSTHLLSLSARGHVMVRGTARSRAEPQMWALAERVMGSGDAEIPD